MLLGIWALWDHIYDCVYTTSDFHAILDGKFTSTVYICHVSSVTDIIFKAN
jgi:hypothetical protein